MILLKKFLFISFFSSALSKNLRKSEATIGDNENPHAPSSERKTLDFPNFDFPEFPDIDFPDIDFPNIPNIDLTFPPDFPDIGDLTFPPGLPDIGDLTFPPGFPDIEDLTFPPGFPDIGDLTFPPGLPDIGDCLSEFSAAALCYVSNFGECLLNQPSECKNLEGSSVPNCEEATETKDQCGCSACESEENAVLQCLCDDVSEPPVTSAPDTTSDNGNVILFPGLVFPDERDLDLPPASSAAATFQMMHVAIVVILAAAAFW